MTDQKAKYQNRRPAPDMTMVYGKVPPQAKELEEAVLGAIMLERSAYETVSQILKPECFYVEAHQRIFQSIQRLVNKSQPVDILTVADELRTTEELELVGGAYYVTKLTNAVVSAANVEHHCRLVYERYIKRQLIKFGGELVSEAYEDAADAFDLMDQFEKKYQELALQRSQNTISGLDAELVERFKRMVELSKNSSHVTGIPSGFPMMDKVTHGWQPTDLIILGARPAVGKTALALNLARNATKTKSRKGKSRKVLIFSLEMSKGQLVDRMMSAESEVWLDKITTGMVEEQQLQNIYVHAVQPLSGIGIFIDDTPMLNVYQLRSKARYAIRKFGGKDDEWMIIIDYLQLMSGISEGRHTNREQEISNISRNLKILAKELEVPILALSQLNRDADNRKGEKQVPKLSDLRESGAIEQDADTVMFMYRPEYYDVTTNEMGESTSGLTEISIAKHRHGALAQGKNAIKLRAQLHIQKFTEWDGDLAETARQLGPGFRPFKPEEKDELPFN